VPPARLKLPITNVPKVYRINTLRETRKQHARIPEEKKAGPNQNPGLCRVSCSTQKYAGRETLLICQNSSKACVFKRVQTFSGHICGSRVSCEQGNSAHKLKKLSLGDTSRRVYPKTNILW